MRLRSYRLVLLAALAVALVLPTGVASARPEPAPSRPDARIVVGVAPGAERAARQAIASAGGTVVERGSKGRFLVAEVPGATANIFEGAVEGEAGVTYADPDRVVRAAYVPNDPDYASQWHLPKISAPFAWDTTRGDAGTTIAIIDGGVDLDHPDLADNIDLVHARSFLSTDPAGPAYMNPLDAQDYDGHGTHVAGIAAAATDNGANGAGVAGSCTILPVRALNTDGWGMESDIADAIYYATDSGADVINMSLGAAGYDPTMGAAVSYALAHDVVVVAAAGNAATSTPFYPAAYNGVLAVSATTGTNTRASFSNYGSWIDLAAPGLNITSTQLGGGTITESGTSMASPVVAGAAALVRSQHPGWTQAEVASALTASAKDLGAVGRDDYFGYGLVNVADAIDQVSLDDDIPGVSLSAASVAQRVNAVSDPHDVYALSLTAGKRLTLTLTGDAGTSIGYRLLSTDSTSLAQAGVIAQSAGSYPKTLTYEVPASGTYYVDVTTASGSGTYSLSWSHGYPTVTGLSGPTVSSWGGSITLTGTVRYLGGAPVVGGTVIVEARPYGGSWSTVSMPITDASGGFSAIVAPAKRTEYRAILPTQAGLLASMSDHHVAQPRAYLGTPSAPSSVYKGRSFTAASYLKPRHTAGGRDVKLAFYRAENGKWRHYKSVYATNANYSSYTKYSARTSLPYRGRWKIVASIAGDTTHLATTSGSRYLTVK